MAEHSIIHKSGWKPEIRRSRTLSMVVKGPRGEASPRLTVEDAVDIVRQSPLWANIKDIELIRVANTNGKASHVFVQFEGELMARRHINAVDAMPYAHRETRKKLYVHASQLNSYYEYETQPGVVSDPLVWWNSEYRGLRSFTLVAKDVAHQDACDSRLISDEVLLQAVSKLALDPAVEAVRRVDMATRGVFLVILAVTGDDARRLARAASSLVNSVCCVTPAKFVLEKIVYHKSRQGDSEVSDRTILQKVCDARAREGRRTSCGDTSSVSSISSHGDDDAVERRLARPAPPNVRVVSPPLPHATVPPSPAPSSVESVASGVQLLMFPQSPQPSLDQSGHLSRSQSLFNASASSIAVMECPYPGNTPLFLSTHSSTFMQPPQTPQTPVASAPPSPPHAAAPAAEAPASEKKKRKKRVKHEAEHSSHASTTTSYDSELCAYYYQ